MIDAYPNGRASITDSYIGNMANLLCQYPRTVAIQCADPIRGVSTKTKFIPTVADVVEWCEPLTGDMQRTVGREDRIAEQLRDREKFERKFPPALPRDTPQVEIGADGKHAPGTILSNYSEALRLYGRPVGAFEPDRSKPYNTQTRTNQS